MNILQALKPSRVHAVFLALWGGFLLLELVVVPDRVLAAFPGILYPLALTYLFASLLLALPGRSDLPLSLWWLLFLAGLLIALDQGAKQLVLRSLPLEASRPLIPGSLYLRHTHNLQNSWLASQFGLDFLGRPLLIVLALLIVLVTVAIYRYYTRVLQHSSRWVTIAAIGMVAGAGSAFLDMVLYGYTVDFIGVVGLVVADFKDLYLDVAIVAVLVETVVHYDAAREVSSREMLWHVKEALRTALTRSDH